MNRRDFLAASMATAAAAAGAAAAGDPPTDLPSFPKDPNKFPIPKKPDLVPSDEPTTIKPMKLKGNLKQSVCRWCFNSIPLEELSKSAAGLGLKSVELLGEKEWSVPAKYGMTCAVANGPTTIRDGINRVESHAAFEKECERMLPLVKKAGIPNMIVFSGNRKGMADGEGLKNCAAALKRVTPMAEAAGVTIIMELLNSKVDHGDYMCDRTPWGVDLVKEVGSDRFRLLYDIYHMQIMEGDVIRTITDHGKYIAHYHTAGNPGRRDLDGEQELNYKAICEAIVKSGYTGYLGQEFMPKKPGVESLKDAVLLCDV